jgi:hypothetical protein
MKPHPFNKLPNKYAFSAKKRAPRTNQVYKKVVIQQVTKEMEFP